jgi:hypothetical protein
MDTMSPIRPNLDSDSMPSPRLPSVLPPCDLSHGANRQRSQPHPARHRRPSHCAILRHSSTSTNPKPSRRQRKSIGRRRLLPQPAFSCNHHCSYGHLEFPLSQEPRVAANSRTIRATLQTPENGTESRPRNAKGVREMREQYRYVCRRERRRLVSREASA